MPSRFDHNEKLVNLNELTDSRRLQEHFDGEGTAVMHAFVEHGERELTSPLRALTQQHTERMISRAQGVACFREKE